MSNYVIDNGKNKIVGYSAAETDAEIVEAVGIALIATLTAGSTTLTISNAAITTSSTLDFYTDAFGVNPTNATVENGVLTLTFEAQQNDVVVKVIVK